MNHIDSACLVLVFLFLFVLVVDRRDILVHVHYSDVMITSHLKRYDDKITSISQGVSQQILS